MSTEPSRDSQMFLSFVDKGWVQQKSESIGRKRESLEMKGFTYSVLSQHPVTTISFALS